MKRSNSIDCVKVFPTIKPSSNFHFNSVIPFKETKTTLKSASEIRFSTPSTNSYRKKEMMNSFTLSNIVKNFPSHEKVDTKKKGNKFKSNIAKYFPSIKVVKDYKRSIENFFDLEPIKIQKIKEYSPSELKLKSSEPKIYGLRSSSLTFLHHDRNVGYIPRNFFFEKTKRKLERIDINPSYSNFILMYSLLEKEKSKVVSKNVSPNIKGIIGIKNNRNDIIKNDDYIFKRPKF